MRFEFTPDEAQTIASAIRAHLRRQGYKVRVEELFEDDVHYRTTLVARKSDFPVILVEAMGVLAYSKSLQEFALWLAAQRKYCELYLATHEDSSLTGGMLKEIARDGVGLMLVDDRHRITVHHNPRNPALVVTPEPTLKFGKHKAEVQKIVEKFNHGERKDALRDMCELVERETEALGIVLIRKGHLKLSEANLRAKDWSGQIDTLASENAVSAGHAPVVIPSLKNDFHSFRGARNLVDHKVKTKREDARRQRQYQERMMMGPRLFAELISLKNRVR